MEFRKPSIIDKPLRRNVNNAVVSLTTLVIFTGAAYRSEANTPPAPIVVVSPVTVDQCTGNKYTGIGTPTPFPDVTPTPTTNEQEYVTGQTPDKDIQVMDSELQKYFLRPLAGQLRDSSYQQLKDLGYEIKTSHHIVSEPSEIFCPNNPQGNSLFGDIYPVNSIVDDYQLWFPQSKDEKLPDIYIERAVNPTTGAAESEIVTVYLSEKGEVVSRSDITYASIGGTFVGTQQGETIRNEISQNLIDGPKTWEPDPFNFVYQGNVTEADRQITYTMTPGENGATLQISNVAQKKKP